MVGWWWGVVGWALYRSSCVSVGLQELEPPEPEGDPEHVELYAWTDFALEHQLKHYKWKVCPAVSLAQRAVAHRVPHPSDLTNASLPARCRPTVQVAT